MSAISFIGEGQVSPTIFHAAYIIDQLPVRVNYQTVRVSAFFET